MRYCLEGVIDRFLKELCFRYRRFLSTRPGPPAPLSVSLMSHAFNVLQRHGSLGAAQSRIYVVYGATQPRDRKALSLLFLT